MRVFRSPVNSSDAVKSQEKKIAIRKPRQWAAIFHFVSMLASGMCSYVNAERCVFVVVLKAIDLRGTG
jgi:hypothetical protein